MDSQAFLQQCLSKRFLELRSRSRGYSLRAFARDLQQNPAALSQILRGKRRVSKAYARALGERLGLTPQILREMTDLFDLEGAVTVTASSEAARSLAHERQIFDERHYELVADWTHYA